MSEVRADIAPFFDHSLNVTPNGRVPAAVHTSWHMICWSHEDSCARNDQPDGVDRIGNVDSQAPIGAPRVKEHARA